MRGHVQKKNGNWYVVLELDRDENGRRRQKWISPRKELGLTRPATKKQAEELLVRKLKELQEGTYFEPAEMTLGEYLQRWLEDYCRPNLRQTTLESYADIINLHIIPEIGNIPLAKLKPAHLQKLYSSKLRGGRADGREGGLSPRYVRYIHSIIREALGHAVRWELVTRNVAEAVQPPRDRPPVRQAWTAEEAQQFLDAVRGHRLYPLYLLAISTGMRRGELLGLRWQDIDWRKGVIYVRQTLVATNKGLVFQEPKTEKSRRAIAVSPAVLEVLRKHRRAQMEEAMALGKPEAAGELVFTSERGTPLHPRNLLRHFARTTKKAGLPSIPFHGLRHTHATIMLQEGVHPKVVSERLGHTKISTTMDIYSHVMPDLQAEAAEKFEALLLTKGEKKERT